MSQERDGQQDGQSPCDAAAHRGACLSPTDFAVLAGGQTAIASPDFACMRQHMKTCEECRNRYEHWKRDETLAHELREAALGAEQLANPSETVDPATGHAFPLISGYRILGVVGRGGMGIVYEAIQISLGRHVALKVLPAIVGAASPDAITRFRREAISAGKLHHVNIVPIYDYGSSKDAHFCAMELIDGRSLDILIPRLQALFHSGAASIEFAELLTGARAHDGDSHEDRSQTAAAHRPPGSSGSSTIGRGSVYFRQVATWITDVADALDHAHREGVIHRDIKPSNLILARSGRIMIADFGLARDATDHSVTRTGGLLGTLRYMSPEQAMAKRMPLDHRTDVYSLGATFYELLTFRAPFIEKNDKELLGAIITKDPKPPRKLIRGVPKDLETICLKTLEKSPDKRYYSARDLADDLRRFTGSLPILARRPSLVARLAKTVGRNKAAAFAILTTLLLTMAVAVILVSRNRDIENQIMECASLAQQERHDEVIQCATKLRGYSLSTSDRAENLYRLANARKGMYNAYWPVRKEELLKQAIDDVNEAINLDEMDAESWNLQGVLFKMQGDFAGARQAYERSLQIEPSDAATKVNIATVVILGGGDVDAAARTLRDMAENENDAYRLVDVWRNLASIQWLRGSAEAAESIDRALQYAERAPREDYGCHLLKARILLSSSADDTDAYEAIALAEQQTDRDKPLVCRVRAKVSLATKKWERALESAEKAIRDGDDRCYNQLIIAIAAASLGKVEEARAAMKAAESSWPARLRASGEFMVSAPEGVLWFDTYYELKGLSDRAAKLLEPAEAPHD